MSEVFGPIPSAPAQQPQPEERSFLLSMSFVVGAPLIVVLGLTATLMFPPGPRPRVNFSGNVGTGIGMPSEAASPEQRIEERQRLHTYEQEARDGTLQRRHEDALLSREQKAQFSHGMLALSVLLSIASLAAVRKQRSENDTEMGGYVPVSSGITIVSTAATALVIFLRYFPLRSHSVNRTVDRSFRKRDLSQDSQRRDSL